MMPCANPPITRMRNSVRHARAVPNPRERAVTKVPQADRHGAPLRAGRALLRRLGAAAVLITRGSDGMALFEPGRAPLHIPIYGSDEVADVTGAGDTVIAAFTLALAAGATPAEAGLLANYAGGIVVTKRGTATVSAAELRSAIAGDTA